jgi:hypothetical protein
MDAKKTETKTFKLKKIPPDVYNILLKVQGDKKVKCNCQYSLEQTVYMIIRENAKIQQEE